MTSGVANSERIWGGVKFFDGSGPGSFFFHEADDERPVESRSRPTRGSETYRHVSVLREEVVEFMALKDRALILDATLGGGGHSEALLQSGARVVGVDQDQEALEAASSRLDSYGDRFLAMHANFREVGSILEETGVYLDGLIFDLGVSSWQLDSADRGFSFRQDAPLDLRMDRTRGMTAAAFLATAEEAELADVIWKYGQERASRKVARAIVAQREITPVESTFELSKVVEKVVHRRGRLHPATKVFQALRMHINDELGALEDALEWIPRHLKPGGRVAVISFHSLEDMLVKKWMRRLSREWIDRPEWSEPRRNPDCLMRQVFRRAITPSSEEIAGNPRSRSARLRVAERRADS